MTQPKQEMSWRQIGCLWCLCCALLFVTCKLRSRDKPQPKTVEQIAEETRVKEWSRQLDEDMSHPAVKAMFQAGIEFGQEHRATGLSRLTDREIDGYALKICNGVEMPDRVRGMAVAKFKRGYGWGFSLGH